MSNSLWQKFFGPDRGSRALTISSPAAGGFHRGKKGMILLNSKRLAIAALAGTAVVAGVAMAPGGRDLVSGTGTDLMSMLSARSPGVRSEGAVTTKGPRMAALSQPAAPRRHAAAVVPPAAIPAASAPVALAAPAAVAPVAPIAPAVAAAPVYAAAPAFIPGPGGGSTLLPLPVILPGGGDDDVTITPPSPTPAIPEPGTWLMMIVGFGILGTALRRRRRIEAELGKSGRSLATAPGAGG